MEVKPGYKQAEVGIIPEDWDVNPLEAFTTMVASGKSKHSKIFGSYPVHGSTGIIGYTESPDYEGNAILVARVGANAGRLNIVSGKYGVTDNTIMLRFGSAVSLNFIWRLLEAKCLNNLVFGSGQPLITGSQLKALPLATPTLLEQQAIAAALGDVDALLGGLERLIAKKRDLKQAAMRQLLTGQTRLPGFSGEWEVKRLGDIVDFTNGKPHEGHIDPMGQYYLVTLDSISIEGKLKVEHKPIRLWDNSLAKGDIVTILSDIAYGNLLGLCDLIPENNRYVLNQRVGRLRVKPELEMSPQFLRLQINRRQYHFKMRGQGTSQRHIYRRDFEQLMLELPTFTEQTAIAAVFVDIDAELSALEARRDKTSALKQAMMQELLTGRTRLIEPQGTRS